MIRFLQVIDAEMGRRRLLEDSPIASTNEDPVFFDTDQIPWWAWVKRFHLPEVSSCLGFIFLGCMCTADVCMAGVMTFVWGLQWPEVWLLSWNTALSAMHCPERRQAGTADVLSTKVTSCLLSQRAGGLCR